MTTNDSYPRTIEDGNGEQLTFVRKYEDPERGAVLEISGVTGPGAGPPMHVHNQQFEKITVTNGRMGVELASGEKSIAEAGETVTFAPGEAHRFWNDGDQPLESTGEVWPAGNFEWYITQVFASIARPDGLPEAVRRGVPVAPLPQRVRDARDPRSGSQGRVPSDRRSRRRARQGPQVRRRSGAGPGSGGSMSAAQKTSRLMIAAGLVMAIGAQLHPHGSGDGVDQFMLNMVESSTWNLAHIGLCAGLALGVAALVVARRAELFGAAARPWVTMAIVGWSFAASARAAHACGNRCGRSARWRLDSARRSSPDASGVGYAGAGAEYCFARDRGGEERGDTSCMAARRSRNGRRDHLRGRRSVGQLHGKRQLRADVRRRSHGRRLDDWNRAATPQRGHGRQARSRSCGCLRKIIISRANWLLKHIGLRLHKN